MSLMSWKSCRVRLRESGCGRTFQLLLLYTAFSQRQSWDSPVFLFLLPFWTPFCTQMCPWTKYLEAHTFQETYITLSSSSLCMAYAAADLKAQVRGKTVVEIQGKKEARAALSAFMSPPKVGMSIHRLEEAHVATSLIHSSLEWG